MSKENKTVYALNEKDELIVLDEYTPVSKGTGKQGYKYTDSNGVFVFADGFVFYSSWLVSIIKLLERGISKEDLFDTLMDILCYGIFFRTPKDDCNEITLSMFENVKASIDSQLKYYLEGSSGGRPPKGNDAGGNYNNADSYDSDESELEPLINQLPEEIRNTMRNFVISRKQIGKPLTKVQCEAVLKDLNDLSGGDNQKAKKILNKAIASGWQSLQPLNERKQSKSFVDLYREMENDGTGNSENPNTSF